MVPIPTSEKRPFIPAPGVSQVELVYQYLGQHVENVYHVLRPGGAGAPTVADNTAMANVFQGWEQSSLHGNRSNACSLILIRVRDLATRDALITEKAVAPAIVGGVAGIALPGNVTFAVKWNTGLGGRSFRGRTYHIGMTAGQVSGDQIEPGALPFFLSGYNALLTAVTEGGVGALAVVSFAHDKFWRDVAVATPITAASIDNNLDSQRRRLAGRGT